MRLEVDREVIAQELGAEQREVIFTGGGTEANNLAIKGYAFAIWRETGAWPTIVTDRAEHHAVLHTVDYLASLGALVRYVPVDRCGRVLPSALAATIADLSTPFLVSVMHGNNEVGTLNPIAELAAVVHERDGLFHSDAVQTFGKLPLRPHEIGVDMLSIAAHKIGGPRGVGALFAERAIELDPLLHGGSQERDRRAGTEPSGLIAGFAEGVRYWTEHREEVVGRIAGLRDELRSGLAAIDGAIITTPTVESLPTILNLTFEDAEDLDAEDLKRDGANALPKLHGALLKNEQDVHLFERLAFMARRQGR